MVQAADKQHRNTTRSLEHLAIGWNTFTNSVSHFTSELDKRTLLLSNINPSTSQRYTTPSTESKHTSDDKVGSIVRFTQVYRFTSAYGCLTWSPFQNMGFVATTEEGQDIARIISLISSKKVLEDILNRDLGILIIRLGSYMSTFFQKFVKGDKCKKFTLVQELTEDVPIKTGQWIQEEI